MQDCGVVGFVGVTVHDLVPQIGLKPGHVVLEEESQNAAIDVAMQFCVIVIVGNGVGKAIVLPLVELQSFTTTLTEGLVLIAGQFVSWQFKYTVQVPATFEAPKVARVNYCVDWFQVT